MPAQMMATAMPVAAAPPAGTQMMQVAVPAGVGPGQMMLVNTPGGQMQVRDGRVIMYECTVWSDNT